MKKVLGIGGSPRKGGNSDILMRYFLRGVGNGIVAAEEIQLRDYQFQSCIGCERCRRAKLCTGLLDGMQLLYPKVREASGVILVCPIYNYNITAMMKAFIDRLYCFYDYGKERPGGWSSRLADEGRKAAIVVVGEQLTSEEGGMDLTMEALRRPLEALGYEVVIEMPVFGIHHRGRVKEYPETLEKAEQLGEEMAAIIR